MYSGLNQQYEVIYKIHGEPALQNNGKRRIEKIGASLYRR
jgi:hypothetical protein